MRRIVLTAMLAAGALAGSAAQAQDIPGRVDKLEREMRAVQRKVFPGASGQYLEPEITAPPAGAAIAPGTPATSPVADLEARVTSLEQQLTSLTGQVETSTHRVQELENSFASYRNATDARLAAMERGGAVPAAAVGGANVSSATAPTMIDDASSDPAQARRRPAGSESSRPVAAVDSARATQVAAVEKPSTGDAAEDGYLYGYRLWQAKLYPEAEAQLKAVVTNYPKSKRASYAQNLLGRSYLDEGKPSLASIAFYDNYKKMPDGDRAPDSLYYLAQALIQLKKPADACKVYGELSDVYGDKIDAKMKADIAKGQATAKCQ